MIIFLKKYLCAERFYYNLTILVRDDAQLNNLRLKDAPMGALKWDSLFECPWALPAVGP
eukprot:SAG11_NODE_3532_length_2388_cov_2.694190_1_plen_59_part_00